MLVRFVSSETGEIMMFAEVARPLLQAVGKACTAHGVFRHDEMLAAAVVLRRFAGDTSDQSASECGDDSESPVALRRRAWPLIDMLERTGRGPADANIVWTASGDF